MPRTTLRASAAAPTMPALRARAGARSPSRMLSPKSSPLGSFFWFFASFLGLSVAILTHALLDARAVRFGNVGEPGCLTALQGADVEHYRPPVLDADLRAVGRHGAHAVADRVEDLAHRHHADVFRCYVRGLDPGLSDFEGALGDHAIAGAGQAVTGRAVDAEALLAARHGGRIGLELLRKGTGPAAADLAAVEMVVLAQVPDRHGFGDRFASGAPVGEEGVGALSLVLGLPVHVAH